jgi:Family of unknown function (DUF6496)
MLAANIVPVGRRQRNVRESLNTFGYFIPQDADKINVTMRFYVWYCFLIIVGRLLTPKARPGMARKYSEAAQDKVHEEMHEMKEGKLHNGSGKKVTNPKQAIAIGLSEARKEGKKVPPNPNAEPAKQPRKSTASGKASKAPNTKKDARKKSTAGKATATKKVAARKSTTKKQAAK